MKQLPNKPSALIRLAIRDLTAVEKLKKYKINMSEWHYPNGEGVCLVCLAGSVLARTFKQDPTKEVNYSSFGAINTKKLEAINEFRMGCIYEGLCILGIKNTEQLWVPQNVGVIDYNENPKKFKKQMLEMADKLKKAGL